MGLILDAAMKNFADDHPRIDTTHCLNRSQKRLACDACMAICPKQVYAPGHASPPKWNECQNCGLCVAACPTRCIAPAPTAMKRHALLADQGEAVLSCCRSSLTDGHKEACLAQLPWELIAAMALRAPVTLDCSPCGDCPEADCRALLAQQMERLAHFLGEARFAQRVRLAPQAAEPAGGVSRRDFFRNLARGGRKTAVLALSDSGDGLTYRRLLAARAADSGEGDVGLMLPWLTGACYACGLCAKLCPNGALEMGRAQAGKAAVIVDPVRCTGCGVCRAVCLDGGIEGILPARMERMERAQLGEVQAQACARCGRTIRPGREDGLCAACRMKARAQR